MADTRAIHEKPILFSGEMVRAILDGKKTQTRRVIDFVHARNREQSRGCYGFDGYDTVTDKHIERVPWTAGTIEKLIVCPYGVPGDMLYVKEAWAVHDCGSRVKLAIPLPARLRYRADGGEWPTFSSRSSRFMPRWASRISLEIVNVRVERLQDISEADAIAEGMTQELSANVLSAAAGKLTPDEAYYVIDAEENDVTDGYLCGECAEKQSSKFKDSRICHAACPESDGPAYCDDCNRPLYLSLTADGINSELFLDDPKADRKHFAVTGLDAAIAGMIAGGIGDLGDQHRGRLAQIGYATLWDSINAKRGYSWESSPWVWVIEFKPVTGRANP